MVSKKELAIILSRLRKYDKASVKLEQYTTDSEIASDVLWQAYMHRDIDDKTIADLGSGTGILGIGCLILGAKKVYFVDNDENSLKIAKSNLEYVKSCIKSEDSKEKAIKGEAVFICKDISDFNEKVDTVIQNPPFGTKQKHADKMFLEKAFSITKIIYSFHKLETERFVNKISEDYGFEITHLWKFDFPIKATYSFHRKKIQRIKVGCWRIKGIK